MQTREFHIHSIHPFQWAHSHTNMMLSLRLNKSPELLRCSIICAFSIGMLHLLCRMHCVPQHFISSMEAKVFSPNITWLPLTNSFLVLLFASPSKDITGYPHQIWFFSLNQNWEREKKMSTKEIHSFRFLWTDALTPLPRLLYSFMLRTRVHNAILNPCEAVEVDVCVWFYKVIWFAQSQYIQQ